MKPLASLALATAALWLTFTGPARAWCQMTTTGGQPSPGSPCVTCEEGDPECQELHWRRRCISYGVELHGTDSMPLGQVREVVGRSFQRWQDVQCDGTRVDFQLQETPELSQCKKAQYNRKGGNINTIAFLDEEQWDKRDYDPSAFALTTVWHSTDTGEILDADTQLNDGLGPYGICPNAGCDDGGGGQPVTADLGNVLTHEIGHFFGMGHSEFATATMAATSDRGETAKRSLEVDDIEGFCSIYPPGSLPEACNFEPKGGLRVQCKGDDGGICTVGGRGGSGTLALLLLCVAWLARRPQARRRT